MPHNWERITARQPLTLDLLVILAQDVLLKQGNHQPTLILDGKQSTSILQISDIAPFGEARQQQFYEVGKLAGRQVLGQLVQVFLATEGWMSTTTADDPNPTRPADDPQRKEVLVLSQLRQQDRYTQMRILEMQRDSQGELQTLTPLFDGEAQRGESMLLLSFVLGYLANAGEEER